MEEDLLRQLEYCQCSREGVAIASEDVSFGRIVNIQADGSEVFVRAGRFHEVCRRPILDVAYKGGRIPILQ